jgi:hypothetical protein
MATAEIIFGSSQRGETKREELLPSTVHIWVDHLLGQLTQNFRSNETLGAESCLD